MFKRHKTDAFDLTSLAFEAWGRYGLLLGSGMAAAFGQVLLALLFLVLAVGLFLRVWRRRRR